MYRFLLGVILLCTATLQAAQTPPSNFQPGTITAVVAHKNAPGDKDSDVSRYDVSVKVGSTVYVALFTPPNGSNTVEYVAGTNILVLVGSDTLTFNSPISGRTEVPILRRETVAAGKTLDLAMVPSDYFSMKLQNLSEKLNLTEDQQAKIKPTLEQETGDVNQIYLNSAISEKEKISRFEKIVRASDEKIKPVLSSEQWQTLQDLRKQQKQKLKQTLEDQKAGKSK